MGMAQLNARVVGSLFSIKLFIFVSVLVSINPRCTGLLCWGKRDAERMWEMRVLYVRVGTAELKS